MSYTRSSTARNQHYNLSQGYSEYLTTVAYIILHGNNNQSLACVNRDIKQPLIIGTEMGICYCPPVCLSLNGLDDFHGGLVSMVTVKWFTRTGNRKWDGGIVNMEAEIYQDGSQQDQGVKAEVTHLGRKYNRMRNLKDRSFHYVSSLLRRDVPDEYCPT